MLSEFFFYTSYAEMARIALTGDQYHMFLKAVVYYGVTGTCEIEDPLVKAIFVQAKYSIDASKRRHEKAKIDGAKGGRPSAATRAEVRLYIFEMICRFGEVTVEDLISYYACSKRSILRKCSKKYIEDMIKEMDELFFDHQNKGGGYDGISVRFYAVYFLDEKRYEIYINRDDALEEMEGHLCTWKIVSGRGEAMRWADNITVQLTYSDSIPKHLLNADPSVFESGGPYMVSMAETDYSWWSKMYYGDALRYGEGWCR